MYSFHLTGILPGIHSNLVAAIAISFSPILLLYVSPIVIAVFIVSMFIAHTFADFIPTILIGAPSSETSISVLPGHRLLLEGRGFEAIWLSVIGAFIGAFCSFAFFPLFVLAVPVIYLYAKNYIGIALCIISFSMVMREKTLNKKFFAFLTFLLSGAFGLAVFSLNMKEPLLPMLSGLFGISTLLYSVFQKSVLPKQNNSNKMRMPIKEIAGTASVGVISSAFISIFPAVGPNQAVILSMNLKKSSSPESYLVLVGAVNSTNVMFSLVTLYSIGKARNGAIAIMSQLLNAESKTIALLACTVLIASAIAACLTLFIAKFFLAVIQKINYNKLCICVIAFVALLVLLLSGPLGFFIMIIGAAIGLIPQPMGFAKHNLMGCLIIPVILYFI